MIDVILSLLANNTVLIGSLNLATMLQTGASTANWIKELHNKSQQPDALLVAIFISAGIKALKEQLNKANLLLEIREKSLTAESKSISPEYFSEYFKFSIVNRDISIREGYRKFFSEIKIFILNKWGNNDSRLDLIFQDIEDIAYNEWRNQLYYANVKFPQLQTFLDEQNFISLSKQIDGSQIPSTYCGADQHILNRRVEGPCWAQSIKFFTGECLNIRPGYQHNDFELSKVWWEKLASHLEKAPLFLTGPGGMGKSAFLVYLYDVICGKSMNTPFNGAFLLSLDTLMSSQDQFDFDGEPFREASKSILLKHIAIRSGNSQVCEGWKRMFSGEQHFLSDKPILLLLDGFNEMRARKENMLNKYTQIMCEIKALSNQEKFPNVRLIVTSRADSKSMLEEQLNELLPYFQHAELGGICEYLSMETLVNPEIRELLKRPMYFRHLSNHFDKEHIPSTQYEVLKKMYQVLWTQSIENTGDQNRRRRNQYIMTFLMPIVAYSDWSNKQLTSDSICSNCIELTEWLPMIKRSLDEGQSTIVDYVRYFGKQNTEIIEYLSTQEQVLYYTIDGYYTFLHQDYRDYLVAEYFLQRMEFMTKMPDQYQWKRPEVQTSLCLNTYSQEILRLIYQAIYFSATPEAGEPTAFVQRFLLNERLPINLSAGHILWYTTVYQLTDMQKLVEVTYGGDHLESDTLRLLEPLISFSCQEPFRKKEYQILPKLEGILQQHLIEILMKACELYRRRRNYSEARRIIQSANYIYSVGQWDQQNRNLYSIINHNEAMVSLYDFAESGDGTLLRNALEKLLCCVEDNVPYRFSCNMLARILVSPDPEIANREEYTIFCENLLSKISAPVFAFWLYYDALWDSRKTGEDWLPRLYSLRQLLYLLAENKVKVNGLSEDRLLQINVELLDEFGRDFIVDADNDLPIPTHENLKLISHFLEKITGIDREWKHYMLGLINYFLFNDNRLARDEFKKAGNNDVRALLWIAFIEGNSEKINLIYAQKRPAYDNDTSTIKIEKYNAAAYYQRDIGALADALTHMNPS